MLAAMSLAEENAEVLEGIASRGADLSIPRLVDFAHLFYSEGEAIQFKEAAERAGYQVSLDDEDSDAWDVVASLTITPTVEAITRIEMELDALAQSLGGHSDGWGFQDA